MKYIDNLDPRLKTIALMVRNGTRLADVGCDHGYLITALACDDVISGGVACDINRRPLDNAIAEVKKRGLEKLIECRLGSGLEPVAEEEVDDIAIAGMGGELIASIIENSGWKSFKDKHFILQPMSRAPHLRRWLLKNGFQIKQEKGCYSAGHYYTVMSVYFTGEIKNIGEYDPYVYIGELCRDNSEEAEKYLSRTISELEKQRKGASFGNAKREKALAQLIEKIAPIIERRK